MDVMRIDSGGRMLSPIFTFLAKIWALDPYQLFKVVCDSIISLISILGLLLLLRMNRHLKRIARKNGNRGVDC